MTTRPRILHALLALTLALFARPALAQVSVAASLSSDRVYVGDAVRLDLEVAGAKNPPPPTTPDVPGLLIELAGSQDTSRRQIMIVNGRRSEDVFEGHVFSFRILALQPGRYTIPPITLTIDGKQYETDAVQITAEEPGNVPGFKLQIEADKQRVYVGEPVRLRITWSLTAAARGGTFSMPDTNGAFELLEAPPPPNYRGDQFTLFGKPAVAIQGEGILDGERCQTIAVDRVFVARKPGKVTVGPLRLAFDMETGRGIFGRSERKVIASNALTFEVLPLPQPAPPGFTGLVGKYAVDTRVSSTNVHVGDPITLTISVRGPEPLDLVPPIDLHALPAFQPFKLSSEPLLPTIGTVAGARAAVSTTTIRAEHDRVSEIPPVELPYFDVETGAYGVARSNPIPINVAPTTEVALAPDPDEPAPQEQTDERTAGLAPITRSIDTLAAPAFNLPETLRSPLAIGVLGVPALAYLGSVGVVAVRRRAERDPAGRRRRNALPRALRRLRRAGNDPRHISDALRGYAADRFNIPEAGATSAECARLIQRAGAPDAPRYAQLLDTCDAALYAGATARPDPRDAASLLRALERATETHP